jgi:hypothetical protein
VLENYLAVTLVMLIEDDAQMRVPDERTMDLGAHQVCCPLLQALFMTARTPKTMSAVAATIINIEVFIAASRCGAQPSRFSAVQNERTVNALKMAKRLIGALMEEISRK